MRTQKQGTRTDVQAAALDEAFPSWRETSDTVWHKRLEAVSDFVTSQGRFPRPGCLTEDERLLGKWLSNQKSLGEKLNAPRRALLDEKIPGWDRSAKGAWYDRLGEVCAMAEALGRPPRTNDKALKHRTAAAWLSAHRSRPENDWRVIALSENLPEWDQSLDKLWDDRLAEVVAFVDANGRLPNQHDKSRRAKTLGLWISTQRKVPRLSEYRLGRLNHYLPGWRKDPSRSWTDSLDYVVEFHACHSRFPGAKSTNDSEAKHGRWLVMQRKLVDSMSLERRTQLDTRLPNWRTKRTERWGQNFEAVAAYFEAHGSHPSSGSDDPAVALLGRWWQRRHDPVTRNPERDAAMDERFPGWRN